jgi:microcystin-dependent protein
MSTISKPYTFSAGATIVAAEHNSNFDTMYADHNGNITNANISGAAAIAYSKLALSGSVLSSDIAPGFSLVPTGVVLPYGGSLAPTSFLLCDGSAVSRSTYSILFSVIGTAYGVGDNSTTFNLPDMRENVPVGYKSGSAQFGTLGGTYGEKTHALTAAENAPHTHTVSLGGSDTDGGIASNGSTPNATVTSSSSGTGDAHNNIQPSVVFNYIIKT